MCERESEKWREGRSVRESGGPYLCLCRAITHVNFLTRRFGGWKSCSHNPPSTNLVTEALACCSYLLLLVRLLPPVRTRTCTRTCQNIGFLPADTISLDECLPSRSKYEA